MVKLLVLYYSSGGTTRRLAHLIARGVEEHGAEAVVRCVPRVSSLAEKKPQTVPENGDPFARLSDLEHCDGLLVGSPTRFGNMAAPLKYFIDQTSQLWMNGKLADKPVSFFTSSSSLHGGQESTLLSMMIPFIHHGMVICGLPVKETALMHTRSGGTPYGVSHWNGLSNDRAISDDEKKLAIAQGKRTAMFAQKLKQTNTG